MVMTASATTDSKVGVRGKARVVFTCGLLVFGEQWMRKRYKISEA
jgi:hypothetical protein